MVAANDRLQSMWRDDRSPPMGAQFDIEHLREAVTSSVQERPLAITLAAFGIGLGLGVGLCSILMESCTAPEPTWKETLSNHLNQMLPEAVARHFRSA